MEIFTQLGQFGATGLLIAYLVWDNGQKNKNGAEQAKDKLAFDRDRLEADKGLAAALAALKTIIEKLVP